MGCRRRKADRRSQPSDPTSRPARPPAIATGSTVALAAGAPPVAVPVGPRGVWVRWTVVVGVADRAGAGRQPSCTVADPSARTTAAAITSSETPGSRAIRPRWWTDGPRRWIARCDAIGRESNARSRRDSRSATNGAAGDGGGGARPSSAAAKRARWAASRPNAAATTSSGTSAARAAIAISSASARPSTRSPSANNAACVKALGRRSGRTVGGCIVTSVRARVRARRKPRGRPPRRRRA